MSEHSTRDAAEIAKDARAKALMTRMISALVRAGIRTSSEELAHVCLVLAASAFVRLRCNEEEFLAAAKTHWAGAVESAERLERQG